MKTNILSAIVALIAMMAPAFAQAQEPAMYTSEKLGISVVVPDNAVVAQEDDESLVLQTPDMEFALSLIPYNIKETPEDEQVAAFAALAQAAQLDTENCESKDINSETMQGTYKMSALGEGGTCVGIAVVGETGLAYYVTITASEKYLGYILVSPQNLNIVLE